MLTTDPADLSASFGGLLNWDKNADSNRVRRRASARLQYQKRKTAGRCVYLGCPAKADPDHKYCQKHLARMSRVNRKRCEARKAQGVCIYCGIRPQFWGVRCLVCRQLFIKNRSALPVGARRALRIYREAEHLYELEQLQTNARFAIRKLLAAGDVTGDRKKALCLYAGLDTGRWRTYQEVGRLMQLSKERIRQLLHPSKVVLTKMLGGRVPWKPLVVENARGPCRGGTEPKSSRGAKTNPSLFSSKHKEFPRCSRRHLVRQSACPCC